MISIKELVNDLELVFACLSTWWNNKAAFPRFSTVLDHIQRILQLVHGLLVDGSYAVVDEGAAEEDSQGKDPAVILVVSLQASEWRRVTKRLSINSRSQRWIFVVYH